MSRRKRERGRERRLSPRLACISCLILVFLRYSSTFGFLTSSSRVSSPPYLRFSRLVKSSFPRFVLISGVKYGRALLSPARVSTVSLNCSFRRARCFYSPCFLRFVGPFSSLSLLVSSRFLRSFGSARYCSVLL